MLKSLVATLSNQPILVESSRLQEFVSVANVDTKNLESKLSEVAQSPSADNNINGDFWDPRLAYYRPYLVDKKGNLHVPIKGSLLNGFPYSYGSYATGYDYIYECIKRGLGDSDVINIILNVNSGGGMVDGCFELADYIYESRAIKPIVAVCDSRAYSAAYALASSAEKIYVPKTGGVGSVGVVTMHVDYSKFAEDVGYKVTYIYSGKHKVDGNPFEPLPESVKARIQSSIDETYTLFVATVARNRSISEAVVKETEARCLDPKEAEAIGFVDGIKYPREARASFATDFNNVDEGEETMTTQNENAEAKTESTPAVDTKAIKAEGFNEGVSAERARIGLILNAPEAANKQTMAKHLAFSTSMSADESLSLLKVSPEEASASKAEPEASVNAFQEAMANGNPNIKDEGDEKAEINDLVVAYKNQRGVK